MRERCEITQLSRRSVCVLRNPQRSANWGDSNSLANRCSVSSSATTNANNRDSRLNSEINNRSAVNLRSFHIPSAIGTLTHSLARVHVAATF